MPTLSQNNDVIIGYPPVEILSAKKHKLESLSIFEKKLNQFFKMIVMILLMIDDRNIYIIVLANT